MNISNLSGVGAARAHSLFNAGVTTVEDLLNFYPRDYDDRSEIKTVAELTTDAVNTIRGIVATEPETSVLKRKNGLKLNITKINLKDSTGTLEIVWYNQPYLKKYFKVNSEYVFTGKVQDSFGGKKQMQSPEYEPVRDESVSHGRIVPVYTTPRQYSQKTFRALIKQGLEVIKNIPDFLPDKIKAKYSLVNKRDAVFNIHFPKTDALFLQSRRRLVFEELFFMQLSLLQMKESVTTQKGITLTNTNISTFTSTLPFVLTNAQQTVLKEISDDIAQGKRLNRLVQGDVGSGKTVVAMAAAYMVMQNGYQAALMAPTEVLATQHYENCQKLFAPLGYETVLLTGSLGAKAKREAYAKIEEGTAGLIIGTHALIQEKVHYKNLALAITDEQHRFGVNQRLILSQKGENPHTLVMTATPIPRTLGMILYGDLDISVINELPPGRQEIKTYSVNSSYQTRLREFIRKEVSAGRQVYIICPAIEGQEDPDPKLELKNVLEYTAELKTALPDLNIAHLHGKMKPALKQEIMDNFKAGNTDVLVSTTVIEVGVHVANATLMIIENADRFGLSQLHQLRGRVGRGQFQSYCVLITDIKGKETKARMKAMCDTTDGFKLAELDLKLRGAGDFFGTKQHGLPTFKIANLYRDMEILKLAQDAAVNLSKFELTESEKNAIETRIQQVLLETYGGVM